MTPGPQPVLPSDEREGPPGAEPVPVAPSGPTLTPALAPVETDEPPPLDPLPLPAPDPAPEQAQATTLNLDWVENQLEQLLPPFPAASTGGLAKLASDIRLEARILISAEAMRRCSTQAHALLDREGLQVNHDAIAQVASPETALFFAGALNELADSTSSFRFTIRRDRVIRMMREKQWLLPRG